MNSLPNTIEAFAASRPSETILMPKCLLHLGSKTGVDQVRSRLGRQQRLLRVGRGAYVAPMVGKFEPARVVGARRQQLRDDRAASG